MWDEEDVLNIIHCSPLFCTCEISSAIRLSESAVWHTVYENRLCPFSVWLVEGLQPVDKHPLFSLLVMGATREWKPFNLCAVCCGLTSHYLKDVVYRVFTACKYGQWRITIHSSKGLLSVFEPEL
jgi:hypothetical protein